MSDLNEISELFKALSDPTRLKIIELLSSSAGKPERRSGCNGGGTLCVNALAGRLGVTQSAVSQHLRVLRQAGLVERARYGNFVHYSLSEDGVKKQREALERILGG